MEFIDRLKESLAKRLQAWGTVMLKEPRLQPEPWYLKPLWQTILSLLVVFIGLLGSLYSQEIRSAWPFYWGPYGAINTPALIFWSGFILAATGYFVSNHARRGIEREESEKLRQAVLHSPPTTWMRQFVLLLNETNSHVSRLDETATKENIEEGVRLALDAIIKLVNALGPSDATLGASLMIYFAASDLNEDQAEYFEQRLRFCDKTTAVKKLRGLLDHRSVFATRDEGEPGQIDTEIVEFALAIPVEERTEGGKYRIVPGAPFTFLTKELAYFGNAEAIVSWVKSYADLTSENVQEIQLYFTNESKVRSFVSVPVLSHGLPGAEVVAVLNVHSDRSNLLFADEQLLGILFETLSAFNPSFVKLLALWSTKQ